MGVTAGMAAHSTPPAPSGWSTRVSSSSVVGRSSALTGSLPPNSWVAWWAAGAGPMPTGLTSKWNAPRWMSMPCGNVALEATAVEQDEVGVVKGRRRVEVGECADVGAGACRQ